MSTIVSVNSLNHQLNSSPYPEERRMGAESIKTVAMTAPNKLKLESKSNILARKLWPTYFILRILGKCPFYKIVTTESKCEYDYCVKSWTFLYCAIVTSLCSIAWILTMINFGLRMRLSTIFKPNSEKEHAILSKTYGLASFVIQSYFILNPATHIMEYIIPWLRMSSTCQSLNNWKIIQTYYESCHFNHRTKFQPNLRTSKKLLLGPTFLLSIAITAVVKDEQLLQSEDYFVNFIWVMVIAISMSFGPLMEDVKINVNFAALQQCFKMTRKMIASELESLSSNTAGNMNLSAETVRSWTKLVVLIRQQNELVSRSQGVHQLLFISLHTIMLTQFSFLLLRCVFEDGFEEYSGVAVTCIIFGLISATRIFVKCCMAENITAEEEGIATDLVLAILSTSDVLVKMELNFLHNLICEKPTTITYGNIITLNKRFYLSIIGQVVTYLIILIQFNVSVVLGGMEREHTNSTITLLETKLNLQ